jgi:ABC-type iron transport system FetAB permease component
MDNFKLFVELAFKHVLDWQAYDHILFFIVLTVVYKFTDWKKALLLITFFTIGHTLTLGLATFNIVTIKKELIEFLIPLTILITAGVNIFTLNKKNHHQSNTNIFFAFFFGLIHGLGLSGFLKMTLDDGDSKLFPLFEFALGVEFAQILIVILILIAGYVAEYFLRIKKRDWVLALSSIVIGIIIPMLSARKFW